MTTILEARQLGKTYSADKNNATRVLHNIDLSIMKGEFVSIMGPSGSGKSTLLYTVSGMDRPSTGDVFLEDENISGLPEENLASLRLSRMGFVFQQSSLLKNLCIMDNIVLPAYKAKKEHPGEINRRAEELMNRTGISAIARNGITQVSGGQLQRAAICRALINRPDILFGDEPTGALNSKAAAEVMDILADINAGGTTILLVTHDAKVAARSDRVLFMIDGSIAGEFTLGKYDMNNGNWKSREEKLLPWLGTMGF